jgi:hypothetical protein
MSSFHVDARIDVKLEYELAVRLGEFIVNSGTVDKQILALGFKLYNMDEESTTPVQNSKWQNKIPSEESSFASEWTEAENSYDATKISTSMHDKVKRARVGSKIRWGHE